MTRRRILDIIKEAISRADQKTRERIDLDDIIPYLEEVAEDKMIGDEAFYYIVMGIAWEYQIPLTPKEVNQIRKLLNIPPPAQ